MQRCDFCGSYLPVNAHFCGYCGRLIPDENMTATDITYASETDISEPQTPPLFSNPSYQTIEDTEMSWEDTDATFQTRWSTAELENVNPQFTNRKTDDNETVLSDLLLPGILAVPGQLPSPAQAPMVQGTPQVGGVPSVQGTPAAPGNAPLAIQGQGLAHGAGSSAPSSAPEIPQSPPIHHPYNQPIQHVRYESPPHHYQPVHHPQPTPPPHEQEHHHRDHRHHSSRLHRSAAVTSKAGMSAVSKWLIIALTAIIVIASSSVILAHALMPGTSPILTVTGANVVRDGGLLHLHGQGFQPNDSVTLTIDNGLPVSLADQHGTQDISQSTERNVDVTGLSQMFIAGALETRSAAGTNITVSSSGTFDANVTVPFILLAGKHTIHATENQGSQSASLQFSIPSSELAVNPTALNFGSVEAGRTVKLSITVSNQGGTRLHWTASVDGSNTNWLSLPNSTGVIDTNGSDETITVTANTNGLSNGPHSATLRIHSDNSDVQIAVKINVIPTAQSGQQAILNVPQQNLDFGQLQTSQQAQKSISIADLGNLPLKWQASSNTASATWLSLVTSNGTVQTGAAPQTVQVKVNTTGLAAGSYTGTINITSNGGNATVTVTFAVNPVTPTPGPSPTPSPSPSPSPSPIPTVTGIKPSTGPATGGTAVVITGTGFTGATSVTFGQTAASKVTVKSDTQITAISPAGSNTVDVTVTTPGGASAISSADRFTYTIASPVVTAISPNSGSDAGGTSVTITGTGFTGATSVSFGQTAAGNVSVKSDTQITATSPAGSDTVDVTVTTSSGTSAVSSLDQFTYTVTSPVVTDVSPDSGPVTGGTAVVITGSGFTGATSVTFGQTAASKVTVKSDTQITATSPAGSDTVNVTVTTPGGTSVASSADRFTYTTVPPTWSVSPTSLDSSKCGLSTSCTLTLTEDASSTVNIDWTVSSDVGATFDLTKGTLEPGSQQPVSVSGIACKNGTITFTGSADVTPLKVSWNCTPPPTPKITVTPQKIDPTSTNCSPNSDGTYNCTVTVGETSPGNLNWFAPTAIGGTNVSFKPSNGQLSTSLQQQSVTISSIPCSNTSFTFTDQNNNTAIVTWSCTPPTQTPSTSILTLIRLGDRI